MWEYIESYDHNNQYTDDRIFDINKEDKTITKIKGQPLIAGERNSQYIAFQMPRYYDGIDLSEKDIKVLYVTELGFSDINKVINVKVDDDLMQFGWLVPPGASAKHGLLSFCVEFTGNDYVLKTIPTELEVIDSMNGTEISSEPIEQEWYAEIQTLCNETKKLAADFRNNTLQFVGVIDMTEYSARTPLSLSVTDDNNEWVANTAVFPENGIYKLIKAKGKTLCGGNSRNTNAKIELMCDTVYLNYQQNTVDIYDDKHYTVYHTYNNTGLSEKWTDFNHITSLEIDEKIADAIPFVNKPQNSNYTKVYDFDFDAGAINRIVFPCTLCNYEDRPFFELKVNDLVMVSYDELEIGYVQVITKEGIYVFKMCERFDEEVGNYICGDPPPLEDCMLPTMGEVKKLIKGLTDRIDKLETALAAKEGNGE